MRRHSVVIASSIVLALAGTCAWADGVASWGDNTYGQLGDGNTGYLNDLASPFVMPSLFSGVTVVAAGAGHGLVVQNGAVYGWGNNAEGALGDGTYTNQTSPVLTTLSLLSSGVSTVAAGAYHSLAVKGGAVYAWGYNYYGQVGNNSLDNQTSPVQIAVSTLMTVSAVAAGTDHSLAINSGKAYAWGRNDNGQIGDASTTDRLTPVPIAASTLTNVAAVAAGGNHSLALHNQQVYAWGDNAYGEIGDGTTTQRTAPATVSGLTSATAIAAGNYFSLAVQCGAVWAWGDNTYGQLGFDPLSVAGSSLPVLALARSDIVQVAAGSESSYALASDGTLWVWGDNSAGELGLGYFSDTFAPVWTPTPLAAPAGYRFTSITSDAAGLFVLATVAPVPEPTSLALLALGAAGLLCRRRK